MCERPSLRYVVGLRHVSTHVRCRFFLARRYRLCRYAPLRRYCIRGAWGRAYACRHTPRLCHILVINIVRCNDMPENQAFALPLLHRGNQVHRQRNDMPENQAFALPLLHRGNQVHRQRQ